MPSFIFIFQGGTSLRSPVASHIHKLFDCVVASTATHPQDPKLPPFNVMVGYEFISYKKINSVPPDATAFRSRGSQPNVVVVITWDKEDEGDVDHARMMTQDCVKIIEATAERTLKENENHFYSNYGMYQGRCNSW